MEESEIVEKMQQGDTKAFDWLFAKYKDKAFRMAYLISGSYADSDDIVQETFVTCYLNRKQLKDAAFFQKWLFQILTRIAWRYCKRRGREQPVEEVFDEAKPDGAPAVIDEVIRQEEKKILYRAVRGLEMKQRTVVVLYYFNQLTTKEIAAILGCMEGTVKSRLYTARKNLLKALSGMEQEEEEKTWTKKSLTL